MPSFRPSLTCRSRKMFKENTIYPGTLSQSCELMCHPVLLSIYPHKGNVLQKTRSLTCRVDKNVDGQITEEKLKEDLRSCWTVVRGKTKMPNSVMILRMPSRSQ